MLNENRFLGTFRGHNTRTILISDSLNTMIPNTKYAHENFVHFQWNLTTLSTDISCADRQTYHIIVPYHMLYLVYINLHESKHNSQRAKLQHMFIEDGKGYFREP